MEPPVYSCAQQHSRVHKRKGSRQGDWFRELYVFLYCPFFLTLRGGESCVTSHNMHLYHILSFIYAIETLRSLSSRAQSGGSQELEKYVHSQRIGLCRINSVQLVQAGQTPQLKTRLCVIEMVLNLQGHARRDRITSYAPIQNFCTIKWTDLAQCKAFLYWMFYWRTFLMIYWRLI